ncbi:MULTISPECIES: DUF4082 domain-containing protein [unclassified Pseudofrankia]|uniref:DUF4082 domain-containing protein n=1 Tax=unclassified Pseudofrankia TaxID=2994372 RepID=UPI0008D95F8E|nr:MULTISPECIES: DUF4082 domain-containing protein [unclassified Pseudofrankia]MDT3443499.1 DUF4082 domain-containing protein [Pseudofrankia sp. BMG5.37]OHV42710.1 hypothetical protein BCD48_30115 [Pseudofrankia sp. BMG5.36]
MGRHNRSLQNRTASTRPARKPAARLRLPIGIILLAALLGAVCSAVVLRSMKDNVTTIETVASDDPLPAIESYGVKYSLNVGTSFDAISDAQVTGIRFWKAATTAGPFVGSLYSSDGRALASVTVDGGSQQGWIQAGFSAPVKITAGQKYVVAAFFPKGHWPVTQKYFNTNGPRTVGPVKQTHGTYLFAREAKFPTSSTSDFLFVDPLFSSVSVPAQPAATPTGEAMPTAGPTPTPTSTPTSTVAPTTTAQPTSTTAPTSGAGPTSSAAPGVPSSDPFSSTCPVMPGSGNTGPSSSARLTPYSGAQIKENGVVLDGRDISGTITIYGSNVTIKNSVVRGSIIIRSAGGATIDHVKTVGIAIISGSHHVVRYTDISGGSDAVQISSVYDPVSDVTLTNSYLHGPNPPPDAHYDGIQIRGIDGLRVTCSNLDLVPFAMNHNAGIYLEWAGGGIRNVTIDHNWINGGGYAVRVDAENLKIVDNRFGRASHWGLCNNDRRNTGGGQRTFVSRGNVWNDTGAAVNLCGQG